MRPAAQLAGVGRVQTAPNDGTEQQTTIGPPTDAHEQTHTTTEVLGRVVGSPPAPDVPGIEARPLWRRRFWQLATPHSDGANTGLHVVHGNGVSEPQGQQHTPAPHRNIWRAPTMPWDVGAFVGVHLEPTENIGQ